MGPQIGHSIGFRAPASDECWHQVGHMAHGAHGEEGVGALSEVGPQIGHSIGFRAPISTKSAWTQSRAWHTARVKWCGAENCAKIGPK